MLKGKKILIGITGSIAAYKTILLIRLLKKLEADVKIVLTPTAKDFVSPLVLSVLANNKAIIELAENDDWENHVMLGRWADVFIIAPLSCNTLAKMAVGICDNMLLATWLSATCPIVVAPAMDEDMWKHPTTQRNINTLKKDGVNVLTVSKGELASGLIGEGRMAEPEEIIDYIIEHFFRTNEFAGKKVLITAGGTHEPIDPVRFIGNHSSGKMGFALAEELYLQGAEVTVIAGFVQVTTSYKGIRIMNVHTADEMYHIVVKEFSKCDIAIMAAAVADYKPLTTAKEKIKKKEKDLVLQLIKNKDILAYAGSVKKKKQFLLGFALETNNEQENALNKLKTKKADAIVLNSLKQKGAGFGLDTNKITILHKDGTVKKYSVKPKSAVAKDIVSFISNFV
ncbi:MAG: bifunctional phosphopantothenoylcysteine decarboxylase/phosphopantothenate--cysteine ligase CoaBC [Chitinophagaceae bacterium]|nr:bifunctional phosphopantothenoylcysteine decarboxylase/phosphopantothenate--cysteine ligase CoaBC [Chitinophagaceae bacterium]MCW5905416.1 bifunctional phosphopantothenoylcysteine decarboxylase/phosphopantothenate--cysteine ligase CoaBC [Chitinophagaceae bacterium]